MEAVRRASSDDITKWKDRIKSGERLRTPDGTKTVKRVYPFFCAMDSGTYTWSELYFINQRPLLSKPLEVEA